MNMAKAPKYTNIFFNFNLILFVCFVSTQTSATSHTLPQMSSNSTRERSNQHHRVIDVQPKVRYQEELLLDRLLAPIDGLSQHAIEQFIRVSYNHPKYAEVILPYSFYHLNQLLWLGYEQDQPRGFFNSIFALFHQKTKEVPSISTYALDDLIDVLQKTVYKQCQPDETLFKKLKTDFTGAIQGAFSSWFSASPDEFVDELASTVAQQANIAYQQHTHPHDLQAMILRFLEQIINKLTWDPSNPMDAWIQFKALGRKLEGLVELGLIQSMDELDDLYWSLTLRFGNYLDLVATSMLPSQIRTMHSQISKAKHPLFALEEQNECIVSKGERLKNKLMSCLFKAHTPAAFQAL